MKAMRVRRAAPRSVVLLVLISGSLFRCGAEAEGTVGSGEEEIIGGFPANGATLNAIGAIGYAWVDSYYEATWFEPYCSGTLIGKRTVLTAKHCLDSFEWDYAAGYKTYFAVGADAFAPEALYEVVAVEGAPGDQGGAIGYGHDVGVMHLAEAPAIEPLAFEPITEADVGKDYVAVGYGVQNNNYTFGTRRAGKVEVRATSGSIYASVFGSFEAFEEWYSTGEVPSFPGGALGCLPPIARSLEEVTTARGRRGVAGIGAGGAAGAAGGGGEGGAIEEPGPGGSGGGTWDDDEWLRDIYENTVLDAGYEVLVGGTEGDAQVCYGDSGGPLLSTKKNGKLVVRGVASATLSSNRLVCDLAGVHATFGPGVLEFLKEARRWKDPCKGISIEGQCKGSVARRCTAPDEGPRRLVELDCSLLGQVCAPQPDGTVGCSD